MIYFDLPIPFKVHQSFQINRIEFYSIKVRPNSLIIFLFTIYTIKFRVKSFDQLFLRKTLIV